MGKLVMVIDDSLTVRKILEVMLKREGIEVMTYPDGVEALRTLKAQPQLTPAVIFIDICMPQMDGYTVLRLLRTNSRFDSTLIVMLSKRDSVMDRLKGRLAGATVYMTKPFKTTDILSVVIPHLFNFVADSEGKRRNTEPLAQLETNGSMSLLDYAAYSTTQAAQAKQSAYIEQSA
ncbi:MAG TPA: response regulator [Ktedonobacteraceae bacterium]|nr:response regulator [Ktedonobacteraceae bacterium]